MGNASVKNTVPRLQLTIGGGALIIFGIFSPQLFEGNRTLTTVGLPALLLVLISGFSIYSAWVGRYSWIMYAGIGAAVLAIVELVVQWREFQSAHNQLLREMAVAFELADVPTHEFVWPQAMVLVCWVIIIAGAALIAYAGRPQAQE